MNIALTGASGFIGSVIAKHAANHGYSVTALVRETSKREHIEPYVSRFVTGTHNNLEARSNCSKTQMLSFTIVLTGWLLKAGI